MTVLDTTTGNPLSHEEWLAERLKGIGGSEAASAIGVSPFDDATPLSLYLRKLGLAPPITANRAMKIGTMAEPLISNLYADETGAELVAMQLFRRSDKHTFMFATLDRVRSDGRVVELKHVGSRSASKWGQSGTDEVPPHILVQVVHQMIVSDTGEIDVAALIGGDDFRVYTVERNERVASRIIEMEAAFQECVDTRTPPAIDVVKDAGNLAYLYPEPVGEITLDDYHNVLVDQWETAKANKNEAEKQAKEIKAILLAKLGPAASATLSDGRILTRSVITRQPYSVEQSTYADLRTKKGR